MRSLTRRSSLFALLVTVFANTEKVIFTAPPVITLAEANPGLDSLSLDKLTPAVPSLRTALSVQSSTENTLPAPESWYLLESLVGGQRYELRVCWAAIQPTAFEIDTFNLTHVFDHPELIHSLANYSNNRIKATRGSPETGLQPAHQQQHTILFLRIRSTADFFTSNHTLMQHPTPVDVDIILDPYLGNVLPRSLTTILVYIILLVFASIVLSKFVWGRLQVSVKQHDD